MTRRTGGAEPGDELRVDVRVRPGASRTAVGGDHDGALVVAVSAPAVDGRATEAARRAVAEAFGLRRSAVRLVTGASSRSKVFALGGDPDELGRRLAELLAGR